MCTRPPPWIALTPIRIDTRSPSPGTARVTVTGEVDLATASALRAALLDVLTDVRPTHLVVDLDAVTFLDCAGLSALVAARNAALGAGNHTRVTNPRPIVRRILDLTGMSNAFAVGIT